MEYSVICAERKISLPNQGETGADGWRWETPGRSSEFIPGFIFPPQAAEGKGGTGAPAKQTEEIELEL